MKVLVEFNSLEEAVAALGQPAAARTQAYTAAPAAGTIASYTPPVQQYAPPVQQSFVPQPQPGAAAQQFAPPAAAQTVDLATVLAVVQKHAEKVGPKPTKALLVQYGGTPNLQQVKPELLATVFSEFTKSLAAHGHA